LENGILQLKMSTRFKITVASVAIALCLLAAAAFAPVTFKTPPPDSAVIFQHTGQFAPLHHYSAGQVVDEAFLLVSYSEAVAMGGAPRNPKYVYVRSPSLAVYGYDKLSGKRPYLEWSVGREPVAYFPSNGAKD